MTHLNPAGVTTGAPTTMLGPTPGAQLAPTTQRHLDREQLRAGIVRRRQILADLETTMVAACENAAARSAARTVRLDDRATWDRAMWQRYLDAAARLEPDYGPAMRRLYLEIDQLERLVALPLAP